ncbi:hypothetical protein Dimus_011078, partial [Dionaea muscipula]
GCAPSTTPTKTGRRPVCRLLFVGTPNTHTSPLLFLQLPFSSVPLSIYLLCFIHNLVQSLVCRPGPSPVTPVFPLVCLRKDNLLASTYSEGEKLQREGTIRATSERERMVSL